jgi:hypothetical protein
MPDFCLYAVIGGLIIGASCVFIYVYQQKKLSDEFNRQVEELRREKLWNAGIEAAIQQALSAEVTDSTVLAEVKGLFAQLKLTGYAVIARTTYSSLLSCLARQPGNTELRVYVLEMGRLAYGMSRPEGVPTLYDEQAVQNDILVRTAGGTAAMAPIAAPPHPRPLVSPSEQQTSFAPTKPPAQLSLVTPGLIVFLLIAVGIISAFVVVGFSPSGKNKPGTDTRSIEHPLSTKREARPTEQEPEARKNDEQAVPHRVVGVEDNSLGGRKRTSIRIVFDDKGVSGSRVHATMLKVARLYNPDAAFVFGYWPGDDWKGLYTAGRLEWGKDGKGWSSGDHVPADGKFDSGQAR